MTQKIFRRVEKKYLVNEKQYKQIIKLAGDKLIKDRYFDSMICNVYFDNANHDLIINSIEKPTYKEKVRLRSYGIPTMNSNVYFEIKKKYCGMVTKRREVLRLREVYNYLDNEKIKDTQIMKEIDYCFKIYKLKPSIYIAYNRYSYSSDSDIEFRVTFDYNIRSRDYDLRLEKGDKGDKLLDNKLYIMEVKCLESIPLWFCNILSQLNIYPISFSKYGKIYEKKIKEVSL